MGIGLANVKNRLRLHFGDKGSLAIHEVSNNLVEATVKFPLVFATSNQDVCAENETSMVEKRYETEYRKPETLPTWGSSR